MNILQQYSYRVFGNDAFPGNPTTIVKMHHFPEEAELLAHSRSLATEDNAYFMQTELPLRYRVRTFSHTAPLKICGHALLATAHHLFSTTDNEGLILESPIFSHVGTREGNATWLGLPRYDFHELRPVPAALLQRLKFAGISRHDIERVLLFPFRVFVVITNSLTCVQQFRLENFDSSSLSTSEPGALILSCATDNGGYAYRYFSPWWGKPEDSATGSAHCYLASVWLKDGQAAQARQHSPEGVAFINVALKLEAVWISGQVEPVR